MSVISAYIADRLSWGWGETTISSDAMLRQALGGRPIDMSWEAPSDWDDLVLCRLTYRKAPWALRRRMKPILAAYRTQLLERERPGVRVVDGELMYSAEWLNDPPHNGRLRKIGDLLDEAIASMDAQEWLADKPNDLGYPHPRLVTPTGDDHVTGLQPDGPAWSGKVDGSLGPIRHDTIHDALDWMDEQEEIDPDGFARGDYYIDSQEPRG